MRTQNVYSLYGLHGQRKYLTRQERAKFYQLAQQKEEARKLFFLMLYYTGARISEVLSIGKQNIDKDECMVAIECLKKRKKGIFRIVPLPKDFVEALLSYGLVINTDKFWNFSRSTASRYINKIMTEGEIQGLQASAKGLRHGFAISAIENNIPLNLIKSWMGHHSISTTAIYLNAVGQEERNFAQRMWELPEEIGINKE